MFATVEFPFENGAGVAVIGNALAPRALAKFANSKNLDIDFMLFVIGKSITEIRDANPAFDRASLTRIAREKANETIDSDAEAFAWWVTEYGIPFTLDKVDFEKYGLLLTAILRANGLATDDGVKKK